MILLIAYTGVRPGSVVLSHHHKLPSHIGDDEQKFVGEYTSNEDPDDCLKYRDVELFKVQGADGNDHVIIMRLTVRLMKGMRNKSLAYDPHAVSNGRPLTTSCRPKFVFHERDDNLALCPIAHVLALAFADNAFRSDWLRDPEDLYLFGIDSTRQLRGIPLEWKQEMLDVPLLRRDTASKIAWTYTEARSAASRLGRAVGFKDPFVFYQGRRGAGEAIDGKKRRNIGKFAFWFLTQLQLVPRPRSAIKHWVMLEQTYLTSTTPTRLSLLTPNLLSWVHRRKIGLSAWYLT